ncbi:PXMP2/4 family protein 4 [Camellia lanceoleosa]|uniref:PXMP2/4 family protein 4 n=1 Tax=Camellia lanceoleosa TaxID=1840588 RepID=A0ACC0H0G9_9ERIC|nr:PXMP2/4 family protein 4 [Camellia lanceoleosa]
MDALSGGNGGFWGFPPFQSHQRRRSKRNGRSKSNDSVDATGGTGYRFPLKQAATAATLALTGDTIAQLQQRWVKNKSLSPPHHHNSIKDVIGTLPSDHDWLRALRMTSYGFLLYGPGSYAWYQFLDHCMPKQTVENLLLKVLLNQIILGPIVIAVVFAWNNLWQGKISELPNKYKKDALPTLFLVLDPCQRIELWGCPSSSSCCFHVNGLYLLELLLVFNYEQVIFSVEQFILL